MKNDEEREGTREESLILVFSFGKLINGPEQTEMLIGSSSIPSYEEHKTVR